MDDRLTILLIGSSAEDRTTYRHFLESDVHYTYAILAVTATAEALARCEKSDLDLILLDYRLPDRDGLEFVAELKRRVGQRCLPIVLLVEAGDEAIAASAMTLGVNDYLVKASLTQDSLSRTVRSVMTECRLRQQLEQQQQQQQALQQRLQQLQAELDAKDEERTADLQVIERECRSITADSQTADSQQTVELLRKSQSLYKSLADVLPLCLFRKDWNDRFTFVNQAFLDLVQLPLEECLGKTTHDLNPPDLAERYLADDLRVLQTGEILDLVEMIEDPETGIRRYVQTVKAPVRNDAGDIVEMQGIFWDITDRKQAAQRLELQSIIICNVAEGVCLVRASDGVIVYTNPRFEYLFGYAPEELNGQHISVVNYGDSLTARSVHATIVDHLDREGNYNYEVHNRKKDGTPFWSRVNASRFEHPDYGTVYVSVQDDITDRKVAEDALAQAHQELTYLVEHTPLATIKWDREFRVEVWSHQAETIFGWKAEDVTGKTMDEWPFIFEADREHVQQVAAQMRNGVGSICHNRNYRQDGSVAHCTWHNSVLLDETGHLMSMLSLVQDVTEATRIEAERNQAVVALQESVAKQQALITALPDLVMRISGDGLYSDFVSTDVFNVVGETGDFVGTHVLDSLPPAVGQMRLEAIQAALQTGTLQTYQQVLWINNQAQTEEVRVVSCGSDEVLVVVRDISERVQLEAVRRQADEALRQSEARYRAVIEDQTELITRSLPDGTLTFVNAAYGRLHNQAPEALIGQNLLTHVQPEAQEAIATLLKTLTPAQPIKTGDEPITLSDGSLRWYQWTDRALFDHDGTLVEIQSVARDITDRKQAEDALQESERRLSTLISNLPGYVYQVANDPHYTPEFISEGVVKVTGYRQEEYLVDRTISCGQEIHPDDAAAIWDLVQAAIADRQPYECEYRIITKAGEQKWVWERGQGVYAANGELTHLEGFVTDISDRHAAAEENRQLRERLQFLLSATPAMVYTSKAEGDYNATFVSDNLRLQMGYEPSDFVDESGFWANHLHPDDAPNLFAGLAALFEHGYHTAEYRFLHKDGTYRWMQDGMRLVRNANGEPTEIVGYWIDITDRKQAEEALRESESLLRAMFQCSSVGIVIFNADGQFVRTNPFYQQMVGYSAEDLACMRFSDLTIEADQAENFRLFAAVVNGEQDSFTLEKRYCRRDGQILWVRVTCSCIDRPPGQPPLFAALVENIDDRKQAEDSLRSSEARFRSIFDHAAIGIAQVTLAGRYFNANQAMYTLLGYTKAELQTLTFQALTHPDDLAADLEQNQQLLAGDIPAFSMEKRLLHKQGQVVWAMVTVSRVCDQHGNPQYCIGIVEDITDRKLTEMALQESEERFREIANTIPQMFFVRLLKPDRYGYISPAYETIWGRSRDELLQNPWVWMESIHPDDRAQVESSVASQAQANSVRREYRILRPDGAVRWIAAEIVTVRDAAGTPVRFIGLADDITDRKGAEEALQKSETQYRRIVETATEGIWIIDANSVTQFVNPALTAMLGYSEDEMMGESMFAFMDEEGKAIAANNVKRRRDGIQEQYDFKFRCKDGSDLWVIISTTPILDEKGQYAGVLSMLTDISDRKRTEQELQQAKEVAVREAMRSTEANRAKSIFLSSMSHELRTPLNAILGFSQLMVCDPGLNLEQQENLAIINRSGEHLLTIINDILEMSKIEAGHITFNVVEFDLFGLLDRLEEMFMLQARNKGIPLYCDRALDLPQYIQTDENKLRQILINLLGNALKFTRQGRVSLRVTRALEPNSKGPGELERQESQPESVTFDTPHLAQRQRSQSPEVTAVPTALASSLHLCFEVEDTGAGIDPEELESLFEPFVQSRSGKIHPEGTGLGLPISQQFVCLMGGELTVTSVPDHGSTFAFTIPVMLAAPLPALSPLPRSQGPLVLAPDQPTYRILLVEDTWSNRQLLLSLIQPLGFEVQEAINGQEAVSLWQTWQPHLIWMDIRMPVMDGYEATRRIRAIEQSQVMPQPFTTKIIALTAHAFEEERTNALASGCDDFVPKPLQAASILTKMSEHLGVRYSHGTSESSNRRPSPGAPATAQQQSAPMLLNATALKKMPVEWLLQLHRAATQRNATRLQELIAQMPADAAAIAQALQAMVNNMDFEPITQLAQDATNHTIKHF